MILFRNIYNRHFPITEIYPEFSDREKEFLCKKIYHIRADTITQKVKNMWQAAHTGSGYYYYLQLHDDFAEEELCKAVRKNCLSEREKYLLSVVLYAYRWRFPLAAFFFPILTEEKYAKLIENISSQR